ncbi:MAG: hypothetical protein ACR2II_07880 [Chthoniobacterales bacterium]
MKIFGCILAALVSVALSGTAVTAGATDEDHQVTGTVLELNPGDAVLDTGKGPGNPFYIGLGNNLASKMKVGQKVTLRYGITPRGKMIADKIVTSGKADRGSNK